MLCLSQQDLKLLPSHSGGRNAKREQPIMMSETPGGPEPGMGSPAPAFISLGMVVIDELRFPDGRVLRDVPGGSGFYGE